SKLQTQSSSSYKSTENPKGLFQSKEYRKILKKAGISIGLIGFDNGNGDYRNMVTQYDEIYGDTTPRRVEICDKSTFEASTLCEIQLVKTWSDGSIQIQLNQGAHSTITGKYIYIVNDDNKVINHKKGLLI